MSPLFPSLFRRLAWGGALWAFSVAGAEPALLKLAPLAPRSGPPGETMFTTLEPAGTGVVTENRYGDPRMWGELYQELVYGAIGTGVAVADYDGDGRPDIFVVSKSDRSRLFRNLGGWKFEDVTDRAGLAAPADGAWQQGAAWADVDNDGRLDLYVCRFGAPNLLFMNRGDGTFSEEAAARGLALADACGMAAFCDYDRDGWLDVYVQTNMLSAAKSPEGQRDYLLRNRGDGRFANVTDAAGIRGVTLGHAATWWDYDDDGWPDLYVSNDYATPDSLYRNQGDGTFRDAIHAAVPHMPYYSMGADFGDVNNDGRLDFLAADMAASTHEKSQRGMAGSQARAQAAPADPGLAPQVMRNALYLGTGTGRFREAAMLAGLAATDWTWSPRWEDLDNDGRLDLHVTNGMAREYHNADLLDRIMALENPADSRRMMRSSPPLNEEDLAYRNRGDLVFEAVGPAWGLDRKGVSFGTAWADFDGDGDLDLMRAHYLAGASLLRNDAPGGHRLIVALHGTRSNRFGWGATVRLETADAVQVRQLLPARGYLSSSEPVVHFGLGETARIARLTVSWPSGQVQTFRDLAGDQRVEITEPEGAVPAAVSPPPPPQFVAAGGFALESVEPAKAEASPQPFLPWELNRRGPALAVGALDASGREAWVIGGTVATPARVRRPDGTVTELPLDPAANDGPIVIFDADGDGANDILITKAGTLRPAGSAAYQPRLWRDDGTGTLVPAPADALPPLPISAGAVAAADFDRDGRVDVFVGGRVVPGRYPLPARSALLRNTGGRFEDVTEAAAPGLRDAGLATAALWTDVDGDGWPDLLVALEWGGVRYWHNDAGRGLSDRSASAGFAAAGTGWWTALAAADFNGDGRMDYAVGNVGLNTPYTATAAEPAVLYYGDFRGGGAPLLVEGHYERGRLLPRRTRNELAARLPAVAKRFPKNDAYATATLAEILGEDRLAAARHWTATELRSGVFLSQPDGTVRYAPLPRLAQIAPVQGLVAGDFDGDGCADIYAVQNSHAPAPATGRFDGGLSQLLRGDGRGGFAAVEPAASGLVVTGDAKALVVVDLDGDGWPDFGLTRNAGPAGAYRNTGVAGRRSLRVELRNVAGRAAPVGARVTLERGEGRGQTAEVAAGGGYWSQSSAACFFGLPDPATAGTLRVRWPGGEETRHEVPAEADALVLAAPPPRER